MPEVRRGNEEMKITEEGNMFCHIGNNEGQKGVGFIVRREWVQNINEFNRILKFTGRNQHLFNSDSKTSSILQ